MNADASISKRLSQGIVLPLRQSQVDGSEHLRLNRVRHLQLGTRSMEQNSLERRPFVRQAARTPD
ncbi:MAG: hypothetical protein U9R72_16435 [Chloroflexota bacterium]|nr:hypothetical protein [Chloroflexota bacterium]